MVSSRGTIPGIPGILSLYLKYLFSLYLSLSPRETMADLVWVEAYMHRAHADCHSHSHSRLSFALSSCLSLSYTHTNTYTHALSLVI